MHSKKALRLAEAVQDFVPLIEHEAGPPKFRHQARANCFPNLFPAVSCPRDAFWRCGSATAIQGAGAGRDAAYRALDLDTRVAPLLEETHLGVDGLENVVPVADRLARAEQQITAGLQREVEQCHYLALRVGPQIDEQVAARDQIDLRERRIAEDIVPGKDNLLADLRTDLQGTA